MKKILFIIFSSLNCQLAFTQHKEGFNWITGTTDCRVSFNTIDTMPFVFKIINYNTEFLDGTSCISDSNGNFLFSCDGFRIWDTLGNKMDNGDSLCPHNIMDQDFVSTYTQASLILPFSDGIYYVLTATVTDSTHDTYWHNTSGIAPFDLLLYHKIDMKENGGAGKVIKKAIPLMKNTFISKSQMQACRHSNGVDWWLLKQALDSNIVYRFLITEDSIYGPFVQNFMPFRFGIVDNFGQACFNKEGTKYAVVQGDYPVILGLGSIHDNAQLFIADFDRCTGELSNPKYYNIPNLTSYSAYIDSVNGGLGDHFGAGVCFSENGKYLYVAKIFNIMQFELNEPDSSLAWYHVSGLDTTYIQFQRYQGMYIGLDHKIYIGNVSGSSKEMSVIDKPDIKGVGCNFCPKCLRFPFTGINSPPNMPDYTLGADLSKPCWPLGTNQFTQCKNELLIYPNPTTSTLYIEGEYLNHQINNVVIYNILGQLVYQKKIKTVIGKIELNLKGIRGGVYMLRCNECVRKIIVE